MNRAVSYAVSLADLISIADAACELDGMRMHYADRPDQQQHLAARVDTLHSLVERAAGADSSRIYADDDSLVTA